MTDTEAKAHQLEMECAKDMGITSRAIRRDTFSTHEALCRAIERLEATEARHAAELREQAERFSEVAAKVVDRKASPLSLRPFILHAPDALVEGLCAAISDMGQGDFVSHETLGKALSARGYELRKIGEAGE